jgi:hypothetical protein
LEFKTDVALFNIQRHFLDYFLFSFVSLSSLGVFVFLAGKVTRRLRGTKKLELSCFYSVVPAGGIEPTAHIEIT